MGDQRLDMQGDCAYTGILCMTGGGWDKTSLWLGPIFWGGISASLEHTCLREVAATGVPGYGGHERVEERIKASAVAHSNHHRAVARCSARGGLDGHGRLRQLAAQLCGRKARAVAYAGHQRRVDLVTSASQRQEQRGDQRDGTVSTTKHSDLHNAT